VAIARAQLEAIVDALTVALPAREPADMLLRRFFREHKNLGQRDRGVVADTVYAALRRNVRKVIALSTDKAANPKTGGEIPWNFTKYLVDRDGKVLARFDAPVEPESKELTSAIEAALKNK